MYQHFGGLAAAFAASAMFNSHCASSDAKFVGFQNVKMCWKWSELLTKLTDDIDDGSMEYITAQHNKTQDKIMRKHSRHILICRDTTQSSSVIHWQCDIANSAFIDMADGKTFLLASLKISVTLNYLQLPPVFRVESVLWIICDCINHWNGVVFETISFASISKRNICLLVDWFFFWHCGRIRIHVDTLLMTLYFEWHFLRWRLHYCEMNYSFGQNQLWNHFHALSPFHPTD